MDSAIAPDRQPAAAERVGFGPGPARLPARKAVTRCDELEDFKLRRLYEPSSPTAAAGPLKS